MTHLTLYAHLDVHKKMIAVALIDAAAQAEVRYYGTIANTSEAVRRLSRRAALTGSDPGRE